MMIGHASRPTTYTLSLFGLLAGLAVANVARADDASVFGCRGEDQGTEMVTDCDSKMQEAKVKISKPKPPPTTELPTEIYLSPPPEEGGKSDHDRDRNGHPEHDASGRRI